jgi:hypothetical protein
MEEINRRIAHITTQRLQGNQPDGTYSWASPTDDRGRLATQVLKRFGVFVGDLRMMHADRAAWFDPALTQARYALRPV